MTRAAASPELPRGVVLRGMTPEDIPAGLALCRASRWNQVARDWEQFLRLEPHGAAVAARDGRVIGTVTTLHYARRFGWIAMVLVDPAERGHGVGRALLFHGLSSLSDVVARLDATPAGEALYRTLGFEEEYRLTRFERAPAAFAPGSTAAVVTPLADGDWPEVLSLDARVFGADRSGMLKWLADGAPEYARVCRSSAGVQGFLLGRHGHSFEHLGPIVAADPEVARGMAGQCLARHADRPFILDAPDRHASWQAALQDAGFVAQRPFTRMYRGQHVHRGCPENVFASAGAEFG
jgi:predicted N-acetyltransferase YhbS